VGQAAPTNVCFITEKVLLLARIVQDLLVRPVQVGAVYEDQHQRNEHNDVEYQETPCTQQPEQTVDNECTLQLWYESNLQPCIDDNCEYYQQLDKCPSHETLRQKHTKGFELAPIKMTIVFLIKIVY
jgi:hypothetical protein